MDGEQELWDEARLHAALVDILDVRLAQMEPSTDLDTERFDALRHHLGQAVIVLANPDAHPPRYVNQGNISATEARLAATAARVDSLIDLVENREVAIAQDYLLQLIIGGVASGLHAEREDAAIYRAFRGYRRPSRNDLQDQWPAFNNSALALHCAESVRLDEQTAVDDHSRAITRSRHFSVDPSGVAWVVKVVQGMEIVMYARDCLAYIGKGKEKRERARNLVKQHYHYWLQDRYPADAGLDDNDLAGRDYYETDRELFDIDYDKLQRTRKRFTLMYDCLGPALFLDPTWTTLNCMHVSGAFLGVLKDFDRRVSEDATLADLRSDRAELSRMTLEYLVDKMTSRDAVKAYVRHFFDRCPAKCMEL